jgi:hypothetical protein
MIRPQIVTGKDHCDRENTGKGNVFWFCSEISKGRRLGSLSPVLSYGQIRADSEVLE